MARKPNDPSPYLENVEAVTDEVVSRDFNIFYRPEKRPESKALNSLIVSLSNVVPSLTNYQITEEIKDKEKTEAKALADFKLSKNNFKNLVSQEKIPAGASPHYYNKMMELELSNQARSFMAKFDDNYISQNLSENADGKAFDMAYDNTLKQFFAKNKLEAYDKLALEKAFFKKTSAFRDQKYQQHLAKRMSVIEGRTDKNAIMNMTGIIIENQEKEQSIDTLLKSLKGETDAFMGLGYKPDRANNLLVKSIENYIDTVNDEEGFEYATELLNGLEKFKLGTGYFAGGSRGMAIKQKLLKQIAVKQYNSANLIEQTAKVEQAKNNRILTDDYFTAIDNREIFDIVSYVEAKTYDSNQEYAQVTGNKFDAEEKTFLYKLHNDVLKNKNKEDNPQALIDLMNEQDNNIYGVQDLATKLLQQGQITKATFKEFYKSPRTYNILKSNTYFNNSTDYQNYMTMFKDKLMSEIPVMSAERSAMRNKFQSDLLQWYEENKNKYTGTELQKQLNAEVKATMGEILSTSILVMSDYDSFSKLFAKYGIVIPRVEQSGSGG